nr:hypothetical protein [uncultured Ruminococcus sp.]
MRIIRKPVSLLLILTILIGLFTIVPFEVGAATNVSTWEELQSEFPCSGSIALVSDISAEGALTVPAGRSITLNLNGHKLSRDLKKEEENGYVILIETGATLTLTDSAGGDGGIVGGYNTNGGGVYNKGTLNMQGGWIARNAASDKGGGVYNKGTLNFTGGTIGENTAPDGAGIYNAGIVNISGSARIIGNRTTLYGGGGISNHKKLKISGAEIRDNVAYTNGGGIYSSSGASFEMTGGSVTKNIALTAGSGIYAQGNINMSGSPVIEGNNADDLYLCPGKYINVIGGFGSDANIGVTAKDTKRRITGGYSSHNSAPASRYFFESGEDTSEVGLENGEAVLGTDGYIYVSRYWDDDIGLALRQIKHETDCIVMDSNTWYLEDGKTYVVTQNTNISQRLFIVDEASIILYNNSTLTCAGAHVQGNQTLNVYSQYEDTGKIYAEGGSGKTTVIGGNYGENGGNINFFSGKIEAKLTHQSHSAVIGGGEWGGSGRISIYGGSVKAYDAIWQKNDYQRKGATIGSGEQAAYSESNNIRIYGGSIDAASYSSPYAATIGGGYKSANGPIDILGGRLEVVNDNAGGIGSGTECSQSGVINIKNCYIRGRIYDYYSENGCAGIGSGSDSSGQTVNITDSTVNITVYSRFAGAEDNPDIGANGAGIGGGQNAGAGNVTIKNSVIQSSSFRGAGIGCGNSGTPGTVLIEDSWVAVKGKAGGAGIGGGDGTAAGDITIRRSTVTAITDPTTTTTFYNNKVISSLDQAMIKYLFGSKLTEFGGSMYEFHLAASYAAGVLFASLMAELFTRTHTGAGIGGGDSGNGGNITIEDCLTEARGGDYAAGIGGGNRGTVGTITITGGEVTSTSTEDAAGLGSGNSAPGGVTINLSNAKVNASCPQDGSGIGTGDEADSAANITITNCDVTAHGGRYGAGIGGGDAVSGGTIVIENCSSVVADSETDGAGIGGGEGGNGGNITIRNCSRVTATGGGYAAGIGGGDDADGDTVVIENSTVNARGGTDAAGIGGGEDGDGGRIEIRNSNVYAEGKSYGAGIGAGEDGDGGYCSIDGNSTVEAVAGKDGWGISIGYGDYNSFAGPSAGTLSLSSTLKVKAGSGKDSVSEYKGSSRYDAVWNSKYAKIYPCEHSSSTEYQYYDTYDHARFCAECGSIFLESKQRHDWVDGTCTVCGVHSEPTALKFIEQSDSGERITELQVPLKSDYIAPECQNTPTGSEFVCWKSNGIYYAPGDVISFIEDKTLTAVYLQTADTTYIDKNGAPATVRARVLTNSDLCLTSGRYVLGQDLNIRKTIFIKGQVELILADGKTMTFVGDYSDFGNAIRWGSSDTYTSLNIYGQQNHTGTLSSPDRPVRTEYFAQYGGTVTGKTFGADNTMTVAGGVNDVEYLSGEPVRIVGGNVTAYTVGSNSDLILGWSSRDDSFKADRIHQNGNVTVTDGKELTDGTNTYSLTLTSDQIEYIGGKTLTPYIRHHYAQPDWEWSNEYTDATAVFRCTDPDCGDVQRVKAKVAIQDSGKNRTAAARCSFNGEEYSTTQTFQIIFDIAVDDCAHGTVSARQTTAHAGEKIALDITADDGYSLSALYYTDSQNKRTYFEDNSFTMPASDVTVTAVFEVLDSVEYIDEDGAVRTAPAKPVTNDTTALEGGWYYIDGDVELQDDVVLDGSVKLILCDGAKLTTRSDIYDIGKQSSIEGTALTLYRAPGENEGTLSVDNIYAETLNVIGGEATICNSIEGDAVSVQGGALSAQHIETERGFVLSGGDVSIDGDWFWAFDCNGDINISGGSLYVKPSSGGGVLCYGDFTVSGGTVDVDGKISSTRDDTAVTISGGDLTVAGELRGNEVEITGGNTEICGQIYSYNDITLGWTNYTDSIYAATYIADNLVIVDGQTLTDGTDTYSGTYAYAQLGVFNGKTLTPYVAILVDRVEPYIDESGDYKLGTAEHYRLGDKNYAVNSDGSMGGELSDLSLSYFDFTLNGSTYQINRYTGPVENMTLLEIPKTFKGKKITILGNNSNTQLIDYTNKVKKQYKLRLTENIEEIKPYTFYTDWVSEVTGNTSNLKVLGNYAFSWVNSPDGFKLDIKLDHVGSISTGSGAFNHMNVIAHLKHATELSTVSTWYTSLTYDFTDAHIYGSPAWTWSDDHTSAAANFTCTDNRCKHQETVEATVAAADERSKTTYTATAGFNGVTYTDTKIVEKSAYDITVAAAEHGSVSASPDPAYVGEEVTLTVTPDTGYKLQALTVKTSDGHDVEVSDNKFIMPGSDVTVTATFETKSYSINYTESEGGWISGVYSADYGEEVELTPYPLGGYELDTLTVTASDDTVIEVEDNKFTVPDSDVTVTATFKKRDLSITYVVLEGEGTVTGASTARVGDEVPITVTPDEGYAYTDLYAESEEWLDPANIIDNVMYMIEDNVTVYVKFVPVTPAKEPWIDENGEYHLGNVEYCEMDGFYFDVKDDQVGDPIDSVDVSYFEFELLGDGTYQIDCYCGPTDELTELVIPKTYQGRQITVLGTDHKSAFIASRGQKSRFVLTLNENIREIKGYAFYTMWVSKVRGDTSNLKTIGDYAFSWVNSPGGYTLDIKLDYPGRITAGYEIFNHMNVTARIKHATTFSKDSFSQQSINYIFTDDHTYGAPVWSWLDDNSAATAIFTCTDPRCRHQETVDATITRGEAVDGKVHLTASVEMNGTAYTDEKEIFADAIGARLIGHSISLDGDIGVNFYMELADNIANSDTAYMHFTIPKNGEPDTKDIMVSDARKVESGDKTYYVFKCQVAAKEMTSVIKAQIIDGYRSGTEYTYSVKEYADYLLEHAEEREDWSNAVPIVKAMINYGAYSQIYFDKNPTDLANAGLTDEEKALADVDISAADPIIDPPDGVTFVGATLSLKSETTLSLYFTADSQPEFSCGDYTVEPVQNGRYYAARIRGIAAKHIGDTFTLNVGSGSITYSPLNYIANTLNGGTEDENLINAVKALYWYWKAADAYFPD